MEKLEIMIQLASVKNIEKVLLEFKEYASEVDVEFVRKSVLAIGRCAIKIAPAAERCIQVLLELIQTKVNYVVQEAIIVIKDIFRKYPNRYESIIATLCENLDTLDEPDAKVEEGHGRKGGEGREQRAQNHDQCGATYSLMCHSDFFLFFFLRALAVVRVCLCVCAGCDDLDCG
jgi:hypothetical protein